MTAIGRFGGVVQHVVGAAGLAACVQLAPHDDAALGERDLLAHLPLDVPARLLDGGRDALGADVAFAQRLLVHDESSLEPSHFCCWREFDVCRFCRFGPENAAPIKIFTP